MMPENAHESRGLVKACIRLPSSPLQLPLYQPLEGGPGSRRLCPRNPTWGSSEGPSSPCDALEPERLQASGGRNAVGVPAAEAVVVVEHRVELRRRAVHSSGGAVGDGL